MAYVIRSLVAGIVASGLGSFFFVIRPELKDEKAKARRQAEYRAKSNHPSNYRKN